MPVIESLLSVADLAKLLKLSQRKVWSLVHERRAPAPVRVGRAVRFRASAVDQWIRAGCPAPDDLEEMAND